MTQTMLTLLLNLEFSFLDDATLVEFSTWLALRFLASFPSLDLSDSELLYALTVLTLSLFVEVGDDVLNCLATLLLHRDTHVDSRLNLLLAWAAERVVVAFAKDTDWLGRLWYCISFRIEISGYCSINGANVWFWIIIRPPSLSAGARQWASIRSISPMPTNYSLPNQCIPTTDQQQHIIRHCHNLTIHPS